jgi:Ca2+-binding RTX toxin-like protein
MRKLYLLLLMTPLLAVLAIPANANHNGNCGGQVIVHALTNYTGTAADECVGEAAGTEGTWNDWDGKGGADTLVGGGGNDFLHGSEGVDELFGQGGADGIYGGYGNDYLNDGNTTNIPDDLFGGNGNDVLEGGKGNDDLHGEGGTDTLYHCHDGTTDDISGIEDHIHIWVEANC